MYGDHVELTKIAGVKSNNEQDIGRDFASTVGVGGVLGTKFTWPDYGPKLKSVYLNPSKETEWKKWIGIYNQMMLSGGEFRDLYTSMVTTFRKLTPSRRTAKCTMRFSRRPATSEWRGTIELRGLAPGKYRVLDYENNRDLGTIDSDNPKLATQFREHLLLCVINSFTYYHAPYIMRP